MLKHRSRKNLVLGLVTAMLITAGLVVGNFVRHAIAAPEAVIIELKSDPVIVAKTKAEASNQQFDAAAYRQRLIAEQNQFLGQLSAAGISFTQVSVNAPNGPNGEVSNIQFRYNYVFNGITLAVPASAIDTISAMSSVKSVHKDEAITTQLDHAIEYVRAPSLYGNPPQLHMGSSLQTNGAVVVDRRTEADVTSIIESKIVDGSLSFSGGVWQFDQTLRNTTTGASVFAPLRFTITSISSASGTVRVKNADNSGLRRVIKRRRTRHPVAVMRITVNPLTKVVSAKLL